MTSLRTHRKSICSHLASYITQKVIMCRGQNCDVKPRDSTKLFCSACSKLVKYRDMGQAATKVVTVTAPTRAPARAASSVTSTVRAVCTGRPGCTVKPRDGVMCSGCSKERARDARLLVLTTQPQASRSRSEIATENATIAQLEKILVQLRLSSNRR